MQNKSLKILYAVQATGNGHISRASEVVQYLTEYGEVDILLSGSNSHLDANLPVKYRYGGISLFYKHGGGLDYWKIVKQINPIQLLRDVLTIPVQEYDLILNDFDALTSLACRIRKVKSVHWGHQASFQYSKSPRPSKIDKFGEWILKNYCRASVHIGLHFLPYEDGILPPVIKETIRTTEPKELGHLTIYLPQFKLKELISNLSSLNFVKIHIFTSEVKDPQIHQHIFAFPISKDLFSDSMATCSGLITAGGFESPAEALLLNKRMIILPISGQYEQQCNAAALEKMGVPILHELTVHTGQIICKYFNLLPGSSASQHLNAINPFSNPFTVLENKSRKSLKKKPNWIEDLTKKSEIKANALNRSELGNYYKLVSNREIVDKTMTIALDYLNQPDSKLLKKSWRFKILRYLRLRPLSDLQIPVSQ